MSHQVDTSVVEAKLHTASRRASSLHKDRVEYQKQGEASSKNRAVSAGPKGSGFSAPHRAARAATRSLLAQGSIAAGEDMPQISMGCAGTSERWFRKPSISKSGHCDAGEVDVHVFYATNISPDAWSGERTPPSTLLGANVASSPGFDLSLDDRCAFPVLPSPSPKQVKEAKENNNTPEKESQRRRQQVTADKENEDEVSKDWVVVTSEDAEKDDVSRSVAKAAFDGQHPRNLFASKGATRHAISKDDYQEVSGMDWSSAGMPTALIKRLIHGSANTAHRGPHTTQAAPLAPMNVLRAKNLGSSKRERSTPKSPRSNSNSRAMKHTGARH